ncbi:hypothetical protein [Aliamphritea hakodatensis]|uniref:hypothetical protein n=1 Tax=Aliamphritea hakodatensis TaxID=2895352 RepID=UPI0022FDA975|nr:hypothetical protein [Aliamphritea hakodatensis]
MEELYQHYIVFNIRDLAGYLYGSFFAPVYAIGAGVYFYNQKKIDYITCASLVFIIVPLVLSFGYLRFNFNSFFMFFTATFMFVIVSLLGYLKLKKILNVNVYALIFIHLLMQSHALTYK